MAKMTDRELLSLVEGEFDAAMGVDGGQIAKERAEAWKYYLSRKLGNEIEGLSEVVTSDVADVVDGIMPSLLRIFTTADNLVSFDPVGPEDIAAADQESDYVNHVFFKQNPSFMLMYTWFLDALVQKNGVVKAWWDESEEVTQESYQGLDDAEVFSLLEDEELEPLEQSERVAETVAPDGVTVMRGTVRDITFRRVSKSGRVRIDNVPPEEYRISKDARSLDPADARMVGHEREITRSDLIAMGFDKALIEDLPAAGDQRDSEEDIARRNKADESGDAPKDRAEEKIRVREAYIRVDYDGDGRSELRQVFTAGGKILSNEPVDRQPFHVICPQPLPHKHFGRATAEKVMDVQEVTSTLTRQMLDNLYHTNNPGHAVWEDGMGDDTLDDLLVTRIGRVARFARPVNESYSPITVPFTAAATFPMLAHWEKVKRDRTGVSSDGEGLSPEALKNIQKSVLSSAMDMSRMKIEALARIFAETGIKSLFRHVHELLQKHQKKAEIVRLRNRWVEIDPQHWRTRMDMTVNIGLGLGTRDQNLLHLNAIWEKQREIVMSGGADTLVSGRNLFNTLSEIVRNANRKDPEMFFSDPGDAPLAQGSDEAQQLMQMQAQLAERQQQLDAAKQELDAAKVALQHERETARIELQREKQSDDVTIAMEKIRNQLTELDLRFQQIAVPGSRVPGVGAGGPDQRG